jgi:hypothetical protein
VAANPTVTTLYNEGNNKYNVPQLATQATNLSNELTNAVPSGYSSARGFDIGNTAIQNGVAQRTAYLQPQSNAATANYNTASQLASQYVTAGQAQNAQNLLPIQAEAPLLAQQEAAQSTGWNQASQDEFDGLVSKMNAGVTLSATEMSRANVLAEQETSYENAVTQANATIQAQKIASTYQVVPQNSNLVNNFTGSIVNPTNANSGTSGLYQIPS